MSQNNSCSGRCSAACAAVSAGRALLVGEVTAESKFKSHLRASKRREVWAGFMTWPLSSSLLHDASHTTGWKDAPWRGTGPFPKMSGEKVADEDEEDEQVLQRDMKKRTCH